MSSIEAGSNLCQTQLNLPTIFDVLASDDLDSLLKPSFEYVVKMISQIKPQMNKIFEYKHQLYLTMKTLMEWYFLKTSNSSLSEMFYGLQRCPLDVNDKFWRIRSIFFLIYIPLIKDKLNAYYEELKLIGRESLERNSSFVGICRQQFLAWYPVLLSCVRISNILFVLAYITSRTSFATFNLFLQRIQLIVSQTVQVTNQSHPIYGRFRRWIWRIIQVVVFFLQFQDWWNTNGENSSLSTSFLISGFRKVKPPKDSCNEGQISTISHGLCPICENERQVAAVIATTGIIGCYECLHQYITKQGCCPVTGCPTKTEDVMRLFIG